MLYFQHAYHAYKEAPQTPEATAHAQRHQEPQEQVSEATPRYKPDTVVSTATQNRNRRLVLLTRLGRAQDDVTACLMSPPKG